MILGWKFVVDGAESMGGFHGWSKRLMMVDEQKRRENAINNNNNKPKMVM